MKKMKMLVIVFALALGLGAVNAEAVTLTVSSAEYLGMINPGVPAGDRVQLRYLNHLLGMTPGTSDNDVSFPRPPGNEQDFVRSSNDCGGVDCSTLAPVRLAGSYRNETGSRTVNLGTGYTFLIGKYGGGAAHGRSLVWFVGNLTGDIQIQRRANGRALSNWTVYRPTTSVPEGGMTLMLLGGALLGLETLRRRIRA